MGKAASLRGRWILGTGRCALGIALALGAAPAAAQVNLPQVTFSIGEATGNPGDTVEVPVDIAYGALPAGWVGPVGVIVSIVFAPAGQPELLTPNETRYRVGPAQTPSAVLPSAAVTAAGQDLETEIVRDANGSRINVLLLDLGDAPQQIPAGRLFTLALRISTSAPNPSTLPLQLRVESSSATSVPSQSGGVDALGNPVAGQDGLVRVGCETTGAPGGVQATSNRADGVLVSWSPVAGSGMRYQVYRSVGQDSSTAVPLGGLITATSYLDTTAQAPQTESRGCAQVAVPVVYYYWVRSLPVGGCLSAFGGPAAGARAEAVAKQLGAALSPAPAPAVLPATQDHTGRHWAAVGNPLSVLLSADAPIDPASVWAIATSDGGTSAQAAWVPVDAASGWATILPPAEARGEVRVRAGAATAAGTIGPVEVTFYIDTDAITPGEISLLPQAVGAVAPFAGAAGPSYALVPEAPYAAPVTVEIPVPTGVRASGATLYYFLPSGPAAGWYPAESVPGLLAQPLEMLQADGHAYVQASLRHGGTFGLGTSVPAPQDASVLGISTPLGLGLLLAFGALLWPLRRTPHVRA